MMKTFIRTGGIFAPIAIQHGDEFYVPKLAILESLALTKQWLRNTLHGCGLESLEIELQIQAVDWYRVYDMVRQAKFTET